MSNPSTEEIEEAITRALIGFSSVIDVEATDVKIEITEQETRVRLDRTGGLDINYSCITQKIQEKAEKIEQEIKSERRRKSVEASESPAGPSLIEELQK
jgi:hypothetical protein